MGRGHDTDLAFEFDLDADEFDDASEVTIGRSGSPVRILVAVGVVVAVLAAAFALGRSGGSAGRRDDAVPTTSAAVVTPTGVTALLTDGSPQTSRFDADRAVRSPSAVRWDDHVAAFGGTSIPLVDGTRWAIVRATPGAPFTLERRTDDGSVVERRTPESGAGLDLTGDVRVIGLTAEETPIIGDLDRHTFVVAADGSVSAFAEGLVETVVDHGRYAENRCGRWCRITVHGSAGRLSVGSLGLLLVTQFNPAGDLVALMDYTDAGTMVVRILDLHRGEEVARTTHRHLAISGPWLPGWSAGGELFSYVADEQLVVIDTRTGEVRQVPGPAGGFGQLQVAGILDAPR